MVLSINMVLLVLCVVLVLRYCVSCACYGVRPVVFECDVVCCLLCVMVVCVFVLLYAFIMMCFCFVD